MKMVPFRRHFRSFTWYIQIPNFDGIVSRSIQIGWKPSPTQPKPLERGTAQTNLKDVL